MSSPPQNVLTIGSDTCLQQSLRIRCETTSNIAVTWTLDGGPIAGGEFIDVTQAGVYQCSANNECGLTVGRSEVLCKWTRLIICIMIKHIH